MGGFATHAAYSTVGQQGLAYITVGVMEQVSNTSHEMIASVGLDFQHHTS